MFLLRFLTNCSEVTKMLNYFRSLRPVLRSLVSEKEIKKLLTRSNLLQCKFVRLKAVEFGIKTKGLK